MGQNSKGEREEAKKFVTFLPFTGLVLGASSSSIGREDSWNFGTPE